MFDILTISCTFNLGRSVCLIPFMAQKLMPILNPTLSSNDQKTTSQSKRNEEYACSDAFSKLRVLIPFRRPKISDFFSFLKRGPTDQNDLNIVCSHL